MFREEIQNTVSHFNMGLFGYLDLISNPEVPGSNPLVPSFLFFAQSLGFAVSGFRISYFVFHWFRHWFRQRPIGSKHDYTGTRGSLVINRLCPAELREITLFGVWVRALGNQCCPAISRTLGRESPLK
jgi:hypothetical protein